MAVFVTAFAIAGWWLSRGVERLAAAVELSTGTLDSAENSIDAVTGVVESVLTGLEAAEALAGDLEAAGNDAAAITSDVGGLTGDRLAESVEGLEQSLPAMVEAADVIDQGLSALSILGVDRPEVPLGDGLRRMQGAIAGLGEELRERGAELETLGSDLAGSTGRLDEMRTSLDAAGRQVEDVDGLLDGYRTVLADARIAVGGELWPGLVPAIRVVVGLGLASGLTVAWLTWRLAGWVRVWDAPPRVLAPADQRGSNDTA